ncbi:hypothetical protein [Flagellimonas beolgyonensis]|uniref:hypothetical protein n=1 Tax=Flagellimonas beolgyonensis TaxID=864064 RepID=UPI003D64BD51
MSTPYKTAELGRAGGMNTSYYPQAHRFFAQIIEIMVLVVLHDILSVQHSRNPYRPNVMATSIWNFLAMG